MSISKRYRSHQNGLGSGAEAWSVALIRSDCRDRNLNLVVVVLQEGPPGGAEIGWVMLVDRVGEGNPSVPVMRRRFDSGWGEIKGADIVGGCCR